MPTTGTHTDAEILAGVEARHPSAIRDWRRVARIQAQEPWRGYETAAEAAPNLFALILQRAGVDAVEAQETTAACTRAIRAEYAH